MTSISIVIPAYNEENTICQVVEEALAALHNYFNKYEIIIINDCSTDSTPKKIDKLKQKYPNIIHTAHHKKNLGIAKTLEHLYTLSTMDYILEISADGQFNPNEMIGKIAPIIGTYDIIVCQRNHKHYGPYRFIISTCYRHIPKWLFSVDLYDPGCAKCIRREIRQNNNLVSKGVFKEAERCIRAVTHHSSQLGKININVSPPQQKKGRGGQIGLVIEAAQDMMRVWKDLHLKRHTKKH